MASISKEESAAIDKMFSWCASNENLVTIKKSITDVKNGKGLYSEAVKCNGDLQSLKFIVSDHTGIDLKVAAQLGQLLWRLVKSKLDRERMIKSGIVSGIWIYEDFLCDHPGHAKFKGMQFPLVKGVKIGIFTKLFPQQLVGCGCFIKPVIQF